MSAEKPEEWENPHEFHTTEWFAWKERHFGYTPYHVGTSPSGARCKRMPRVVKVRPGVYRCPACGKEFPTATAELARIEAEARSAELCDPAHAGP